MLAALAALALSAASPEVSSLASARTLPDGGSALLFTAGVPYLSAAYAQGLESGLDAGAQLELDLLTSELFAGGTARLAFHRDGPLDVALRGRAGLYANAGGDWSAERNRSDLGLQLGPGVVASLTLRAGVLALGADLPLTLTTARGGGAIAAPRAALSFETPFRGDWSVGLRAGASWHVAAGGAPLEGHPRGAVDVAALVGFRLF